MKLIAVALFLLFSVLVHDAKAIEGQTTEILRQDYSSLVRPLPPLKLPYFALNCY